MLSLDRFLYVKYPLKYNKIVTIKRTIALIVVCWLISMSISVLPLFNVGLIDFNNLIAACSTAIDVKQENIYFWIVIIGVSVVPICILMITNIWILCIMKKNISNGYHRSLLNAYTLTNRRPSLFLKIEDENKRKQLRMTQIFGAIFGINILLGGFFPNTQLFQIPNA